MDTQTIAGLDLPIPAPRPRRDVYRGVVLVLLGGALLGTAAAITGAVMFSDVVLLDVAVTLGIATGILVGVAVAQTMRSTPPTPLKPLKIDEELAAPEPVTETETPAVPDEPSKWDIVKVSPRLTAARNWIAKWFKDHGAIGIIRLATAIGGLIGIILVLRTPISEVSTIPMFTGISAGICLLAAGLAATAVRYLEDLEANVLPEASGLCRGARVVAWLLILAAISEGLSWAGQQATVRVLLFFILAADAGVCYGLLTMRVPQDEGQVFPLDLGVLSLLGSRTNVLASILDTGERQLGIDLRSTWAVEVVRRSILPIILSLIVVGWLSTSFTVVGTEEQGLVETFGVPAEGQPLGPGLHLHWPWPIDYVYRIPVQRIQSLTVGHEGEEEGGPENVLWGGATMLAVAASCGFGSLHPVSRAVVAEALARGIVSKPPKDLQEKPGLGVVALVDGKQAVLGRRELLVDLGIPVNMKDQEDVSQVWVAHGGRCLGRFELRDRPRSEAREALAAMRSLGINRLVLLTGDRAAVAREVGEALGMDDVVAEVLPAQKLEVVRAEQSAGRTVMMVGDGVNDAPALGGADVGVAVGAELNEVALGGADVALLGTDLRRLPRLISLADTTRRVIGENVWLAFGLSVVLIVLAARGILNPLTGALAQSVAVLVVVANSARILRSGNTKAAPKSIVESAQSPSMEG